MPPRELLDHPVTYVDWHEARAFCEWAAVRLPAEVEWEAAAAGPGGQPFPWGAKPPDESTAWFGHPDDVVGTRPAAERPAGASAYGVLDLAGNVLEWTADAYDAGAWSRGEEGARAGSSASRVVRGGSWDYSARYLRCAHRLMWTPPTAEVDIGLRCVRGL